MKEHPDELQEFLEILSNACYEYLRQQVLSGVNALQIFDSWADLLSDKDLEDFSLRYTRLLTNQLKADPVTSNIPIILFEKAPKKKITDLIFKDISCISLYWQEDIESIAKDLKNKYTIIIISHHFNILKYCDDIYEIRDKKINPLDKNKEN